MKGSIFKLFEEFVVISHGPDAYEDLLDTTTLETEGPFVGPGTYPPGDLVALLMTAASNHDTSVDALLQQFGRFAFASLAAAVPTLMEGLDDPRSFLLGLESVIHTEVRKLYPDADPPRFTAIDRGPDQLELHYQSDLGLFSLVEGLLDGLGDWYQCPVEHERTAVDGTNAVFLVTVGAAAPSGDEPALAASTVTPRRRDDQRS
jgi:hypothetical protein